MMVIVAEMKITAETIGNSNERRTAHAGRSYDRPFPPILGNGISPKFVLELRTYELKQE